MQIYFSEESNFKVWLEHPFMISAWFKMTRVPTKLNFTYGVF